MANIRLGLNNCFAVKRWPNAEDWVPVVVETGIRSVQWSLDLCDPKSSVADELHQATRRLAEDAGLSIDSVFTGGMAYASNLLAHPDARLRDEATEWYQAAIRAAVNLGAAVVGGHMGALSVPVYNDESARRALTKDLVNRVLNLADAAAKHGISALTWEIMPVSREYPASLEEAHECAAALKSAAVPVGFCVDLGHACRADARPAERDPLRWLVDLAPFTNMVQLQQTDGRSDCHWPFTTRHNARGVIDAKEVLAVCEKSPSDRLELVLEIIHPNETPDGVVRQDIIESARHWLPLIGSGGTG